MNLEIDSNYGRQNKIVIIINMLVKFCSYWLQDIIMFEEGTVSNNMNK